ncbi:hypothetical protein Xcom_05185 [Xanthomonas axonopodis pv. commiphoreae]|nr:hypothetical protein Xcom_05185 [Xanthomonas axonopodis pv. commiphoreae]OQP37006.1 hypothetical protein IB62_017995 [Xanthomonas euvesicatoria]
MLHLLDRRSAERGLPGLAAGWALSPSQGAMKVPVSVVPALMFPGVHRRVTSGAERQLEV